MSLPPFAIRIFLEVLVIVAAIWDIRTRRIPNWLTLSGVILAVAINTFIYQPVSTWFGAVLSLKGLGLAFCVYFVLYLLRAMGAGDVKLMAAVGSLVGWQDWFGIFLITAMLGGVMAMMLMVARRRLRTTFWNLGFILGEMGHGRAAYMTREELDVKSPKSVGLPHGAVIAVGTIFFLAISAHFVR
jgi:prepilin peptidase CpaA